MSRHRSSGRSFALAAAAAETLLCVAGAAAIAATPAIEPATTVRGAVGHFSDPYPAPLATPLRGQVAIVTGTTKAALRCPLPLRPSGCAWTPLRIDAGTLAPVIAAAGDTITNFQNLDAWQDGAGRWHAVLAIGVRSEAEPRHWTVLVHAHPDGPARPADVPLAWSADAVLAGSFAERVEGNYDGKYVEADGRLWLLYVKNVAPAPDLRNGIVLQPMISPREPAPEPPVTLLMPGDRFGPLASEWYDHTRAKLVEAPWLFPVAGKWALIYSTGAYRSPDYKAGIAWSDTLIPRPGLRYRKVLAIDTAGVWGAPGRPEVRYLLQSQEPGWPDFTGAEVISPGVASVVDAPSAAPVLLFAGFDPADRPLLDPNTARADARRPYFVPLYVRVPPGVSAGTVTDAELATWLQPVER